MASPLLLWINMTAGNTARALCERLESQCSIEDCDNPTDLPEIIQRLLPCILCFDFDHPNQEQLNLLQKTKLQFPSIPILMFTEARSAELMVWALRTRVWDCFIKPVSAGEVIRRLNIMLPVLSTECVQRARPVLMPQRTPLECEHFHSEDEQTCRTAPAQRHVLKHYQEKTSLADMAQLCAMDSMGFSRAFKREQGCTFREFLQRARIEAAADQLRGSRLSVIDIAGAVGFNDPSHFTRQFRQYMGVTPSVYRNTSGPESYPHVC